MCSGMCRESLFYFGRNINQDGYPMETCLKKVKEYLTDNALPYTTCCVLLALNNIWIFIISFCMCRKIDGTNQKDEPEDFDSIHNPNQLNIEVERGPGYDSLNRESNVAS
jgi:hypothetical protein